MISVNEIIYLLEELVDDLEYAVATIDSEWGCRNIQELYDEGDMPDSLLKARKLIDHLSKSNSGTGSV